MREFLVDTLFGSYIIQDHPSLRMETKVFDFLTTHSRLSYHFFVRVVCIESCSILPKRKGVSDGVSC